MTGTSLEYPAATYFKVVARFGVLTSDGADPDVYPDRTTAGGKVTLSIDTPDQLVRVREPDGVWRLDTISKREYQVRPGAGELESAEGQVGVWLVDTSNPNVDPQNATYTAILETATGPRRVVTFNQDSAVGGVVDLVAALSMTPSPGDPQLDGRVAALESKVDVLEQGGGPGGTSDHGALNGLADDDHTQYALADGTRGDFAPISHGHTLADISDYTAPDLSGLVETTDPRLSDARTPTAHDHPISDVTGLQATLDGKQPSGSYAPAFHSHTLDQTTDTATRVAMTQAERNKLAGVADGAEVNVQSDWNAATGDAQILNKPTIPTPPPDASTTVKGIVELATEAETTTGTDTSRAVTPAGLKAVADTKQAAGSYAPASHTHDDRYYTESEIDTALAGKASSTHHHDETYAPLTHDHDGDYAPASHNHDSAYATTAQGAKADTALQVDTPQPINTQTGTSYTLVASDAGRLVTLTNAAAITLTVPGNVFAAGQRVDCLVLGEGMVTVTGDGATVNPEAGLTLVSRAQYAAFTVLFTSATAAVIAGGMEAA